MASLAALRSTATRRLQAAAPALFRNNTQRRHLALGGHSGPAPEWTGVDKIVRSYVPEDYQLAMAILGGYTGLYVIYAISSAISGGGKKKTTEESAPSKSSSSSSSSTEGIPDVESPEFVSFLESDALEKLLESEESLKKLTE